MTAADALKRHPHRKHGRLLVHWNSKLRWYEAPLSREALRADARQFPRHSYDCVIRSANQDHPRRQKHREKGCVSFTSAYEADRFTAEVHFA